MNFPQKFSKVFDEIDDSVGLSASFVPNQIEANEFEAEESRSDNIVTKSDIHDIHNLKSTLKHISISSSVVDEDPYFENYLEQQNIPDINLYDNTVSLEWDREMNEIMSCDNGDDENIDEELSTRPIKKQRRDDIMDVLVECDIPVSMFINDDDGPQDEVINLESLSYQLSKAPKREKQAPSLSPSDHPLAFSQLRCYSSNVLQEKAERIRQLSSLHFSGEAADSLLQIVNKKPDKSDGSVTRRRERSLIAGLNHNIFAREHFNSRPELTRYALEHFHRPRIIPKKFDIIFDPVVISKGKDDSDHKLAAASTNSSMGKFKLVPEKDRQSLSVGAGDFVLLEFIEEHPPLIQNAGMASAFVNYYRRSDMTGEKSSSNSSASNNKRKLSNRDDRDGNDEENNINSENIDVDEKNDDEEDLDHGIVRDSTVRDVRSTVDLMNSSNLPLHVKLLYRQRKSQSLYTLDRNVPRLEYGDTNVLEPDDASPFIGNLSPEEIQPAIVNKLYRAPIFLQEPSARNRNVFLLSKITRSDNSLAFKILRIPSYFLVGQIEPLQVVPRPLSKVKPILPTEESFLQLALYRILKNRNKNPLDFAKLKEKLLPYSFSCPSFGLDDKTIRNIFLKVGVEKQKEWSLSDTCLDENDYIRSFTPEQVCILESYSRMTHYLKKYHIFNDYDIVKVKDVFEVAQQYVEVLMSQYNRFKQFRESPGMYNRSKDKEARWENILFFHLRKMFITTRALELCFNRLCQAPWNTTEGFYGTFMEKDKKGMMMLRGDGDPSGIGEGFAYVRIFKKVKTPTRSLYRSNDDLRKLTKESAVQLLIELGCKREEVIVMKRWDRIYHIRHICNKLAIEKKSTSLARFARISGIYGMEMNQKHFFDQCQEVWDTQRSRLSSLDETAACKVKDNDDDDDEEEDNNNNNDDENDEFHNELENEKEVRNSKNSKAVLEVNDYGLRKQLRASYLASRDSNDRSDLSSDEARDHINTMPVIPQGDQYAKNPAARPVSAVKKITRCLDRGKVIIRIEYSILEDNIKAVAEKLIPKAPRKKGSKGDNKDDDRMFSRGKDNMNITLMLGDTRASGHGDLGEDEEHRAVSGKKTVKKRGEFPPRFMRLPVVGFHCKLEEVVTFLWSTASFSPFRFPVSRDLPRYYDIITEPMSLSDIRKKIVNLKYTSINDFLADIRLIASNCEKFNSATNPNLVKCANTLAETAQKRIQEDQFIAKIASTMEKKLVDIRERQNLVERSKQNRT